MKKIIALVLALCMVLTIGAAFAAEGDQPTANADGTLWQGDTQYDTTWNDSDTGDTHAAGTRDRSMSIGGLMKGDEVKFYKVLGYDQNAKSTVAEATTTSAAGWTVIAPFNSGEDAITLTQFKTILTTGIDALLAGQIARNVDDSADYTKTAETEVSSGNYAVTVATPDAGLYVAIITANTPGVTYNPVFVGVDYYTTTGGDQSSNWVVDTAMSYSNNAMAKKCEITLIKEATENHEDDNEGFDAKAAAVGDIVDFKVKTTVPTFNINYTDPVFVINDVMTSGLELDTDSIHVYMATVNENVWTKGDEILAGEETFSIPSKSTAGYKIKFAKEYLQRLATVQNIIVEYSAKITETSVENLNEEDNTVTVVYSHDPSVTTEDGGTKLRDKTHHYSFTIDGNIWGSNGWKTTEVVKVGLDKNGDEITQTTTLHEGQNIGALAGAEFKLYVAQGCTPESEYDKGQYAASSRTEAGNKIVSDSEGRLRLVSYKDGQTAMGIPGLDAGTYWLKEEKAPEGYIRQQDAVKIEIIPEYYPAITWKDSEGVQITSDDIMKSYTVKINGKITATYVLNYEHMNEAGTQPTDDVIKSTNGMQTTAGDIYIGNKGPITVKDPVEGADYGKIKNTQGVELPSTGGIGTTIFYILGGLLVVGAAVILVARRKAQD